MTLRSKQPHTTLRGSGGFSGSYLTPLLFVFLWSTGFIGAKFGLPYAEPLTFISLRFASVILLLMLYSLVRRQPWPEVRQILHYAFVGVLIHGGFMGTIFVAISIGIEAGLAALISALQPLLAAVIARILLNERTTYWQWCGLALGVVGVALVVFEKLEEGVVTSTGLGLCSVALFSLSLGTVWQKKHCSNDNKLVPGLVIQFAAALVVTLTLALFFESMKIQWTGEFMFAVGWLVIGISIGATALLYHMLKSEEASFVSRLFILTPLSTALLGWVIFDEKLSPLALFGVFVALLGVAIAMRRT